MVQFKGITQIHLLRINSKEEAKRTKRNSRNANLIV
jgi:hypothetical protein